MEDIYELVQTYKNDSENYCCSMKLFSPILDEKEKEHRMENIKNTAAVYMGEVYGICKKKKNNADF